MIITKKIVITDTNIISDLSNANVLDRFVKLDNVYISDMVKKEEINSKTGDINTINKFKTIDASPEQIQEMIIISKTIKGLSIFDIVNFIIARDNDAILATGDNKLKNYSEDNGLEVIRTLKIIKMMNDNSIISREEAIKACYLLRENTNTRIPLEDIDNTIDEMNKA